VAQGTVNGAVSGAATSIASAAAPTRITKAISVAAASGAATSATGGGAFDTAVAATASGVVEYATGNEKVANAAGLFAPKVLGEVFKSFTKKVMSSFMKEESKSACEAANGEKKC
jgi:hypothetical protein